MAKKKATTTSSKPTKPGRTPSGSGSSRAPQAKSTEGEAGPVESHVQAKLFDGPDVKIKLFQKNSELVMQFDRPVQEVYFSRRRAINVADHIRVEAKALGDQATK